MPYIGRGPAKSGAFRILDDVSGSFNGSTTTFALTVASTALTVGLPETLIIAVDGVIQEPGSAYTISGSNIVFGSAPQAEATFWGVELGDVGGSVVNGSIDTIHIADNAITTQKITAGTIVASDLGNITDIANAGGTITLDASTDIILDADGGDVFFKDDGTTFGSATNNSGNLRIKSGTTTALTFTGANIVAAGTLECGNISTTGTITAIGVLNSPGLYVSGSNNELRFYEGGNYVGFEAPALNADQIWVLPAADGSAGQFLSTNASGVLSWATAGGTTINTNADNRVITGSASAGTLNGEADLTFASNVLTLAGSSQIAFQGGSVRSPSSTILDIYASTTHEIRIDTGYSPHRATIQVADLHVAAGNLVIGTAGKGIDFSAATPNESGAGSASNSILDNYEEGTWTPERWDNSESDSESQTYHNRQGVYTLIGNHVFLNMSWNPNAKGNLTDSQAMTIGGIPFTPSGPANIRFSGSIGYPTSLVLGGAYMPIARIDDGANKIQLHLLANGGGQIPLTIAHFGSDSIIDVTIDYTIA